MEGSPSTAQIAYNFTSEGAFFQMPGVAVWVPKDNPEDAKVYIAMKRNYYERIPIAASALDIFDYSSNMHTERQLVLCALATDSSKSKGDDQLLQDAIQLTNDKCEITGSKGTLYIYLPAPPCDTLSSNNYNDLGGMSCFRYYQRLNEKLSSKKIFVFFDNTSTIPYTPTDFDNGKIRFISVEDKPRAKNFQDTYDKTAKDEKNDLYQQAARVMLGNTCFKNVDASKLATCLKKNKADIDNMIAETKNLKDLIDLIEKIKDEQISSNENIQATVNSIQTAIKRTETDFDRLAEAPKSSAKNDIKMWIGSLRTAIINKVAKRLQSKTKQQINISKK